MSGPKHLWSGDWQRESEESSAQHAKRQRQPADPAPGVQAVPRPSEPRRRSGLGRAVAITAVTVLVVAGMAFGLSALLGSSSKRTATAPSVASTPTPRPTPTPSPQPAVNPPAAAQPTNTPPVHWLGMEIQTLPPGAAIVETVALGSNGDRAGLEPGDVILEIDNRPVTGAAAIATALHGLHAGQRIPLQVSQGSNLEQTVITLAAPPTQHP